MDYTIDEIAQRLIGKGIELIPASPIELKNVCGTEIYNKLPKTYKDFITKMGNGTKNGFLNGHSCFLNELKNLNEWANELLLENQFEKKLPKDAFVFWMSQGYQFCYFHLDNKLEQSIFYYREGTNQKDFRKIANSFVDFLNKVETKDSSLFKI